jgi:acetoin:2,6-dichlorophenolindophenol oxidoreductase subunit alpha
MTGKVRQANGAADTAAALSTGGSLISDAKLKQLYSTMLQCRLLTERVRRLRNQPLSSASYAAAIGQEAIATGCAIDLRPQDTITATIGLDPIASLVKGVPLSDIVAQLYAPAPASTPDAGLSAATAVALAHKRKKNTDVVVALARETETTLDGWRKALKFAAARSLPILFVVENNPWEAAPRMGTFDEQRLAGVTNITVDGNDVVAVYRVAYESLARVREGGGPVLVEGKTYRLHGQTNGEANRNGGREPLAHMERYLTAKKLFTAGWKDQLVQNFSRELDAAVRAAQKARYLRASPPSQTIDR